MYLFLETDAIMLLLVLSYILPPLLYMHDILQREISVLSTKTDGLHRYANHFSIINDFNMRKVLLS